MICRIVLLLGVAAMQISADLKEAPASENCKGDDGYKPTGLFNTKSVKVDPYPVQLPGSFNVSFVMYVVQSASEMKNAIITVSSVKKTTLGTIELCGTPSVGNLCEPKNLCQTLPHICTLAGKTGKVDGWTLYTVANSGLGGLVEGTYSTRVKVTNGGVLLACLDLSFYGVPSH